jgi:hypothetical protein
MTNLPRDRRVDQRMSVIWQGRITGDDLRARCRVLNVSASGALIECAERIERHEPIILNLGNGTKRFCEVVWNELGRFGVQFLGSAGSNILPSATSGMDPV